MSKGIIGKLHPPGNNGSKHGAGKITPDGGGNDIVFQTPRDVNQASIPLSEGMAIEYDLVGGQVGNIRWPEIQCSLTGTPLSVQPGQAVTLTWTSDGANKTTIDNGVGEVQPASGGSINVTVNTNATFTLTATNTDTGQSKLSNAVRVVVIAPGGNT